MLKVTSVIYDDLEDIIWSKIYIFSIIFKISRLATKILSSVIEDYLGRLS